MKRNKFSLSHYRLQSQAMGGLFPLTWFEVLPGDTIQHATSILLRCAPIIAPIMHPCHVKVHHWFVPNRLIWNNGNPTSDGGTGGWENFITGGQNGLDNTVHPYITVSANFAEGTLADYLGLPTNNFTAPNFNVSALPFRAYQLIFNEFYRDQDLTGPSVVSTADGADTTTSTTAQIACWDKDYLTTARPTESKGPSVSMFSPGSGANLIMQTGATPTTTVSYPGVPAQVANTTSTPPTLTYNATTDAVVAGTRWFADLGNAQAAFGQSDINNLRHQFAIQRFQEARLRYGSRYVELLRYYGIRSADSRMQRPEYLGGGRSTVQFSEVMQTAPTTSGTQQPGVGQFGGHGISAMRTNRYRRFFTEHGIVMSLMTFIPVNVYWNNIERGWLRGMQGLSGATAPVGLQGGKEDYWHPELQHIGQQQINGLEVDPKVLVSTAFGFQDRYDEYRRKPNAVCGNFRISGGNGLDFWNMAREFAAAPALNSSFVSCIPSNRGFASLTTDQLFVMAHHSIQARRLVAKVGGSFVR